MKPGGGTSQGDPARPARLERPVARARLASPCPHPRVLATAGDWAAWRAASGGADASDGPRDIRDALARRAELLCAAEPTRFPADPRLMLAAVREAQRVVLVCAAAYRLCAEPRFLAAARRELRGLAEVRWPPEVFLTVAEAAFAVALAHDWLHEELPEEERRALYEKVRDEAFAPSLAAEGRDGWINAGHNWSQVCHGALVCAALSFAEHDADLATHVVNRAIAALPRAAAAYAPDGAYPEGPTYWAYGTTFHLVLADALRVALGESFGTDDFPGFLESADHLEWITSPSGRFFNFADNHPVRTPRAAVLRLARAKGRAEQARREWLALLAAAEEFHPEDTRELPLALIWWRPGDVFSPPPEAADSAEAERAEGSALWLARGPQPLAVLRGATARGEPVWLATKGGRAGDSHGHMDVGGFVWEAGGVRWAIDPVRDDYRVLREGGFTQGEIFDCSQGSRRWSVFRLGAEGHNILRFEGAPQRVDGRASVTGERHGGRGVLRVWLDEVYVGQVDAAERCFELDPSGGLEITDRWRTLDRETGTVFQWLTEARVLRVGEGELRLEQGGRVLRLVFQARGASEIAGVRLESAEALQDPRVSSPLPGVTRIEIALRTPARTEGGIMVRATLEEA